MGRAQSPAGGARYKYAPRDVGVKKRELMNKFRKTTISVVLSILFTTILFAKDLRPPVAAKKPKVSTIQGENRTDNYYWWIDETQAPFKKA